MILRRILPLALTAAFLLVAGAAADVVVLDDGRRIEGKIVSETASEVKIETRFGTFTFDRDEVVEIRREKTRDEVYEEKLAAAKTADDLHALGLWCEEQKLPSRARKVYRKALKLDPDHADARVKLGFVRYGGEWMTPAERDRRQKADFAAEMRAKGLVEHEGSWVTPEEKEKLAQGLVFHEGRWMTEEAAARLRGLALHDGEWIAAEVAHALRAAEGFAVGAAREIGHDVGGQAVVIGALPAERRQRINAGLERARAWFDATWGVKPGLRLFGGRLAEFYVFGPDASDEYARSAAWVAGRAEHVPEGWVGAVRKVYGFTWLEPHPVSSARQHNRGFEDLAGHCYHHMGHLMAGRAGYDGRLLPPWYEEAVAGLTELAVHGTNLVFCRSSLAGAYEGSVSDLGREDLDDAAMRSSEWRVALRRALEAGRVRPFDKLAQLEFSQLDLLDIAQSMVLVEWLASRSPDALATFHRELRRGAPPAPQRVILAGHERHALYDRAFRAACGMGFRRADREWRAWFLSR